MSNQRINDNLLVYIEKDIFNDIHNEVIIQYFQKHENLESIWIAILMMSFQDDHFKTVIFE